MEWKGDAWTTVLEIRNELFDEKLERELAIDRANKYLFPILQAMEDCGVKVEKVTWRTWFYKDIRLGEREKINEAVYKLVASMAKRPPKRTVEDGYIKFDFDLPGFCLSIHNGPGSCIITKKIVQKEVPAQPPRIEETVEYEANCTGVDPV